MYIYIYICIYIYILNICREHLVCPQFNASGSFLQTCNNFVEQRLMDDSLMNGKLFQKIYFVKNAKKTYKPSNLDLIRN